MRAAEELAQRFHETYERLASQFGYETREASAKPWADVPEQNKLLMIAVCEELLTQGITRRPRRDLEASCCCGLPSDLTIDKRCSRCHGRLCEICNGSVPDPFAETS